MDTERLAGIEAAHAPLSRHGRSWCYGCDRPSPCDATALVTEVRRLRANLQWIANDEHETTWCLTSPDCCNCHRDRARHALNVAE